MVEATCLFCKKLEGAPELADFSDTQGLFGLVWDLFPSTPGHALLIPIRHAVDLAELNHEERLGFADAVIEATDYIKRTDLVALYVDLVATPLPDHSKELLGRALATLQTYDRPFEATNYGMNNGVAAGRTIHHAHFHIMPRWTGDMSDPRGGVKHMFPVGGDYFKKDHRVKTED